MPNAFHHLQTRNALHRMADYRRNPEAGDTCFFTVNLQDHRSRLFVEQIDLLRVSVRQVRALMPLHIDAWVVLPDHMHALWTLPEGDAHFYRRWQARLCR